MCFGCSQLTELIISVSRTAAVVSCSAGFTSPCLLAAHSAESSTVLGHFWQDRAAQRHCMIPICISGACLKGPCGLSVPVSETSAAASSQSKISSVLPGQSANANPGVGTAPSQVREQQVLTHQGTLLLSCC